MSHAGKLIVIEGPDHVGRTLHVRLLSARLKANGIATHIIGLARSELMGEIVKSRTADTVSYTHLTLPTILLV